MSIFQYLQLQPLEADEDGNSSSALDDYARDDTIDLTQDVDAQSLASSWQHIVDDLELEPDTATLFDDKA